MNKQVAYRNPVKAAGHAQIYHMATMDTRISNGAYRLFAIYIMHAQQKDICWPGRARVAKLLNCSEATITRYNKELINAGYITKHRRLNTSSMTYIEDIEQIPFLQNLAKEILVQRTSEPTVSAPVSHVSAQPCAVKNNKKEEEQVEELAPDVAVPFEYNIENPIKVEYVPGVESFNCSNPYCDKPVVWASLKKNRATCPHCGQYFEGRYFGEDTITWKPPKTVKKKQVLGNIIPDCPKRLFDIMYYKRDEKTILLLLEKNRNKLLDCLNWAVGKMAIGEMDPDKVTISGVKWMQKMLKAEPEPQTQSSPANSLKKAGYTDEQIERLKNWAKSNQ